MSNFREYFQNAELALAAYADLNGQMTLEAYKTALQQDGDGMSPTQAEIFASSWTVLDQYDGMVEKTYYDEFGENSTFLAPTGLSATLFEDASENQVVAIRGTELSDGWDLLTDLIDISLLGTAEHQEQYAALSAKVQEWLDTGTLQSGFSVTGHSLGGFLATNLAFEYSANVAETYIYNAPGLGGLRVSGISQGVEVYAAIANALSPDHPFTIPTSININMHDAA